MNTIPYFSPKWSTLLERYLKLAMFVPIAILLIIGPFAIDTRMANPTSDGQYFFFTFISIILLFVILLYLLFGIFNFSIKAISVVDILFVSLLIFIACYVQIQESQFLSVNVIYVVCFANFYIASRLCSDKEIRILILCILISGIGQAVLGNIQLYGLIQSFNGLFKMTGTFFSPAPFAGFLVIIFPISLGTYLYKDVLNINAKYKFLFETLSLLCFIAIAVVLPSTDSRAAWYAGVASLMYILITYAPLSSKVAFIFTKKFKVIAFAVFALILCFVSVYFYKYKRDSADGRLLIYKISTPMIIEKPVFGWGIGKFKAEFMESQSDYFKKGLGSKNDMLLADNVQYPYNEILHIGVEQGIVGLLFWGSILYFIFKLKANTESNIKYLLLAKAGLISVLIFSLFSYPSEIIPIIVIAIFYLSIVAKYSQKKISLNFQHLNYGVKIPILLGVIILLFTLPVVFKKVSQQKTAFYLWKMGNDSYNSKSLGLAINQYREAYPNLKENGLFLSNYGKGLQEYFEYNSSIHILTESRAYFTDAYTYLSLGYDYSGLKQYDKAEQCFIKSINMIPSHLYPKYSLIKMYFSSGQIQKATDEARKFIAIIPKVKSEATDQMKSEISKLYYENNHKSNPISDIKSLN